ncbi:O-antigen ligase family protein [Mannheimia massilioguelmaensis]|uniref:O-antigen ligase family protein n=1 Tax=Mannheimia massilioguelmaensis TaxID=1604354 RepID=UPI0009E4A4A4|nr:O-antigen ligase [Mannheimia massilioguelmaensis]
MLKINKVNLVNGLVGFFFIICLVVKSGYSISPILLSFIGIIYFIYQFIHKTNWNISQDEKQLIYSYAIYVSLFVLSFIIHQGKLRELDGPTKILCLLTLLPLFRQFPIKLSTLITFIPIGACIACAVAIFDRFYLHAGMAFSTRLMHIQGGDISMSLGMFSLVCAIYYFIKGRYKLVLFCLIASSCGVIGSILSTARGGWIGVPFIVCFIFWAYRKSLSKTFFISIIATLLITIVAAVSIPNTKIITRLNQAQSDISGYLDNKKGADSTSVGARFEMWKSAIIMIKEKPILGWGIQNVTEERKKHYEQGLISKYASQFNHAHNQYLDDASKRGILGLLALLGIFFVPIRFFWKSLKDKELDVRFVAILGLVHVGSVMFYCLSQGFFSHNSGNIFYFFLVVLFYAVILSIKAKRTAGLTK